MREYISKVVALGVLMIFADCLLSEGRIKKYAMFSLSVIFLVCLISPIKDFALNGFSLKTSDSEITVDYNLAVESTVRAVKGFENATVSVKTNNNRIESIVIFANNDKLLENAVESVHKEYLKNVLISLYKTENIVFEE